MVGSLLSSPDDNLDVLEEEREGILLAQAKKYT